jgi:hypothetical protein
MSNSKKGWSDPALLLLPCPEDSGHETAKIMPGCVRSTEKGAETEKAKKEETPIE